LPANQNPLLILEPIYGLANRICLLAAGIALAEKTGIPLRVLWFQDSSLKSRLDELLIVPSELQNIHYFRLGFLNRPIRKLLRTYMSKTCPFYADPPILQRLLGSGFDFTQLADVRKSYLWGYTEFLENPNPYRKFLPTASLQRIIDSYPIDDHTVGVHIRRRDNYRCINLSPTELFERAMKEEIRVDPKVRFFLATDSPEEEARIRKLFSGRILTHRKRSLDRNSPLSGLDALVDLFCLSKCRKLFGCHNSLFSHVAWKLRNIDHTILKRELA
jgi:hypothetical protein